MPDTLHVVLSVFIAVAAGIAASLALAAEPHIVETPWGEAIDVIIGVEIAISLIPPASVIGIGLALGRPDISGRAFSLLMVNVLGLDIFGSMVMLGLHGVHPRYFALESAIRRTAESTVTGVLGIMPDESTINITLLSPTAVKVHATIRHQIGETRLGTLAQTIGDAINDKLGCRSQVTVETIPCQTYSTL